MKRNKQHNKSENDGQCTKQKWKEFWNQKRKNGTLILILLLDLNMGKFLQFSGTLFLHLENMRNNTCLNLLTSLLQSTNQLVLKCFKKNFSSTIFWVLQFFFFNPSSVPLSSSSKTTGMHTLKKKKKSSEYRGAGFHSSRKQDRKI